jgi:hypothetical protein
MSNLEDQQNDSNNEGWKAGGAAAAGAGAGFIAAEIIGGIGLTAMGTAVSVGAAPIIAAGAIVGLAGYGLYRVFGGKS